MVSCTYIIMEILFFVFLQARQDHNKIAPCGVIKVFEFEFDTKTGQSESHDLLVV